MKTKLAFLCGTMSWGGLEMNQLKMAHWLKEKGHEVFIFCVKNSPIEKFAGDKNVPVIYIEEHRRYKYFFAGLRLKTLLKENQITHLIVRSSTDLNICSIAKTFSKRKFHLSYFMEMQLGVSKKNFLHTARFRKIDVWVCSTEFLRNQVLKFTNYPEKRIKIIPPAIDLSIFQKELSKEEARKILHLPESKIILGLIGRLDILKGQLILLQALKRLKNPDVLVCLMGSPTVNEPTDFFEKLKTFIQKEHLKQQVLFLPFQEDVVSFYKAIDVCIMASKSETFGMVTIEALASGTPVIGSNSGGTPEILEHGKLGLLFETENDQDLADKIVQFLNDRNKINLQENQDIIKKYDCDNVIESVEEILGIG